MATSTQWWCVECASAPNSDHPNQEEADLAAQNLAAGTDAPVVVVSYTRTETTQYQRAVTVTATAL